MNSLSHSNFISRERLEEIAYWIEEDIDNMSDKNAYDFLFANCEFMYNELLRVIAGKKSSSYPEINSFNNAQIYRCKTALVCFNLELNMSYPKAS